MRNNFIYILLFIISLLSADIGHLNYIYEGRAFNKPIRVIVKTPGVVPGLADIVIKSYDTTFDAIYVTPIAWRGHTNNPVISEGPQGAPPPDLMTLVDGEKNTYQAELWLMDFGSYNINIELSKNNQSEIINVPVNSISNQIKPMSTSISIILFLLMLLLVAGLVNIITIGYRDSMLLDISSLNKNQIKKSRYVQLISFVIVIIILYFSNNWWIYTEELFKKNLFKPLETQVQIIKNDKQHILQIEITDPLWKEGRISDLIPDHGKIMHLYFINKNYNQLSHLHPKRSKKNKDLFEVVIPPIEFGEYYLFMDITHESGFSETIFNQINYNSDNINNQNVIAYLPSDNDDSYIHSDSKYFLKWIDGVKQFNSKSEVNLNFQMLDFNDKPSALEPYIQMGGHGALLSKDVSTFVHIHPIGTISMASQELFNKQFDVVQSGICYYGLPDSTLKKYYDSSDVNSLLSFPPLILDTPGEYMLWIQAKTNGKIITEKFDFIILSE